MPQFKWDHQIKCARYHGTLPASACLVRFRTGDAAGCQKCETGKNLEKEFGERFDKETRNSNLVDRLANTLKSFFRP